MMGLGQLTYWFFLDFIFVNIGIYISFLIKFTGNIPDYNLNAYQYLFLFITFSYFVSNFISGLYRKFENLSYYRILKSSFKSAIIAIILSMMFGFFFRDKPASGFPVSVFIISIFVNTIIISLIRFVGKLYSVNINIFNRLIEYIFYRVPELIIIFISIYLAYAIRFFSFNTGEYSTPFSPYFLVSIIISFIYFIFFHKFLLTKNSSEQTNFSVLYVMFKTTVTVFIFGLAVLFIFREKIIGFPASVFIISLILNYIFLSIWHILVRRIPILIEVDLSAEIDEDEEIEDKYEPEKDGFVLFGKVLFSFKKFIEQLSSEIFFGKGWILYFVTIWMIIVYTCFMPEYMHSFFEKMNPTFFNTVQGQYYLTNFKVFILSLVVGYLILISFIYLITKLIIKKTITKKIFSAAFYIFGWNLFFYLIGIIIGNFTNKTIFILYFAVLILWHLEMLSKTLNKLFIKDFIKSHIVVLSSFFITLLIFYFEYFILYALK